MSSLSEFTSVVLHVQIWVNSCGKVFWEIYTVGVVWDKGGTGGGRKVPGSSPGWARMPFCVEFACSPHVCGGCSSGCSGLPHNPKTCCIGDFGQRTLAVVSEWVNEWVRSSTGVHELVYSQSWVATWKGIRHKNVQNRLCGSLCLWRPLIKGASRRKRECSAGKCT